jgi:hypothetical protein
LILLVIVLGFLVYWLLVLLATTGVAECPPEVVTVDGRVIGTWMLWVFLLQELLEVLLRRQLLAARRMLDGRDEII